MAERHWLDDLARATAAGRSRRSMLRALGGGLVGAMLASVLPSRPAAAQPGCVGANEPCGPTDRCCRGLSCTSPGAGFPTVCQYCVPVGEPCTSSDRCCAGFNEAAACRDGVCQATRCAPGQIICSYPSGVHECIFTAGGPYECDANGCRSFNCGGCGPRFTCNYGERCCEGRCRSISECEHCGCCTRKNRSACVCLTEAEYQSGDPSTCLANFSQCAGWSEACADTADCCGHEEGIYCHERARTCVRQVFNRPAWNPGQPT